MAIIFDIETSTNGKVHPYRNKLKLFGYLNTKNNQIKILRYTQKKAIQKVLSLPDDKVGYYIRGYDNKVLINEGYSINGRIIDLYDIVRENKHSLDFRHGEGVTLKNAAKKLKLQLAKGEIEYAWLDDDKTIKEHQEEIYKYLDIDVILTWEIYKHFKEYIEKKLEFKEALVNSISS